MPDSKITKNALAHSMKELMAKEPFSKISVGDICQACGMNRKSFYYHFKDKYDLVNWIFYTEFIDSIHTSDYTTGWEFLEDICSYFYKEKEFYRNAMMIQGQNAFREYFSEIINPFLTTFSNSTFPPEEDSEFHTTFFADAFMISIMRWLMKEDLLPPREYVAELRKLILGFAKKIIEDEK